MEKPEYSETITKLIDKKYLPNLINDIYETYRLADGWTISEPKVTEVKNGKIKISINITKYKIESTHNTIESELYTKTIPKNELESFITKVKETYKEEDGYKVDSPMVLYETNDTITIGILISKGNLIHR